MEFFLKKEFLNMEIKEKVEKVKIINGKIETVMKNWMGLSLETIFVKWMQITQNNKWQLKKYSHERCKEERLKYDNDMFVYELAQKKVSLSFLILRMLFPLFVDLNFQQI